MASTHPRHTMPAKAPLQRAAKLSATPAWLQAHIRPAQEILRTKEYTVMGRLSFVSIVNRQGQAKLIDFRKTGPFVAEAKNLNQVLLVSEWTGIPAHLEASKTPCPDCQSTCPFCKGNGVKTCTLEYCAGNGKRVDPLGLHPDFEKEQHCPACKGRGKVTCDGCNGTGKRATGFKGGEAYDPDRRPAQTPCARCNGRTRLSTETPVNLEELTLATFGGTSVLGEIVRFTVIPQQGRAVYQYDIVPDTMGDGMVIAIEPGSPRMAYLLGGVPIRKDVSR